MKKTLVLVVTIALLGGGFTWFLGDRDRGLWLLNNAISLSNPPQAVVDIAYAEQAWQRLDVYPQASTAPVLVFIHGGSWRHGRKDQYLFAADAFIRLGYTVVVPDYVKYPSEQARYPSFAEDGAKALAWVKQNISDYNGDPKNIFLAGHSAGAHTAAMLATDGRFLTAVGLSEHDIRGVAGIAGPYSFIPDGGVTQTVFGPPERYPLMDALNYVDGSEPATYLLHSAADVQVGQYNQEKLSASLREKGVDVETVLYKGLSHIDMVLHLHPWFSKEVNVANDIDLFFRARMVRYSL